MHSNRNQPKSTVGPVFNDASKTSDTPSWVRLGIPVGCAILAALLNFAAVRRQIKPVRAYAVNAALPMGTRLQASNVDLIDLAGEFDRSAVVLEKDLLVQEGESGRLLDLQESLNRKPRILCRNSQKGEILVKSALGGMEGPRENEMTVEVPRAMIKASDEFIMPGKIIHFRVIERGLSGEAEGTNVIGPFRIAFDDTLFEEGQGKKRSDSTVSIAYGLTPDGQLTQDAFALQGAIADPSSFALFPLESRLGGKRKVTSGAVTSTN